MRFWCIAFLIALATCVSARDDADEIARQQFTGTWILNSKKSSAPSVRDKEVWIISVANAEIHIKKSYILKKGETSYTVRLQTDNRGESNLIPLKQEAQTIISKTKWDKRTLIRKYSTTSNPALFTLEITEKYQLSKDGNRLTVESAMRSNYPDLVGGAVPTTRVFDRQL